MKHLLLLFFVLACSSTDALADKATYDLVRYTAPAPWKKTAWKVDTTKKDNINYTVTDKSNGTYCQIFILKSRPSSGDLTSDFETEWKDIVVASYKVTDPPQITDTVEEDGWKVKAGVGTFAFANGTSIAMLTTISGYGKATSIVAVTSGEDYAPAIQALLGSVEMKKPVDAPASTTSTKSTAKETAKPTALQGYMDYNPITKTWTWKLRYPPK